MGIVNFAGRERKTARVNKWKGEKKREKDRDRAKSGKEFSPASPERGTFTLLFFTMIDCISFYFYTAPPHFPIALFPSLLLNLSFSFSPLSPVTPPSLSPPPSPSAFPSYSNAEKGQWHPMLCNGVCVSVCVLVCVTMSLLIYSLLCSHRSMMPCSCSTKQPTDTEVCTESYSRTLCQDVLGELSETPRHRFT